MTPTTTKTPVSSGLFWKKELETPVPALASVEDEAETVVVTIDGVPLELGVLGVGIELDGVEDVEECVPKVLKLELDLRRP
jgi:hypothetical protein